MKLNPYDGMFLVVEGLDGSGSDKVAVGLVKKFNNEGKTAILVKEPSQSPVGRFIKKILRERGKSVSPLTLEFLFAADRALQWEERIAPALKEGKVVVADRYFWSSVAYRSLYYPFSQLLEINSEFVIPDMTFYIDTPPELCAKRIARGEDKISLYENAVELMHVRDAYEYLWVKFRFRFMFIEDFDVKRVVRKIDKVMSEVAATKNKTAGMGLWERLKKKRSSS